MVFNLIDFLLGAKKPKGPAQPGAQPNPAQPQQAQTPPASNTSPQAAPQPAPGAAPAQPQQAVPAQNVAMGVQQQPGQEQPNFQDSGAAQPGNVAGAAAPGRTKVTEVIGKLQEEAKASTDKLTSMITDMKNIENSVNTLNHRVDDLEEAKKVTDQKLSEVDSNMTKFLSLYELINNQYNPFVDKSEVPQIGDPKEIMLDAQGNAMPEVGSGSTESLNYNDTGSGLEKGPATVDLTSPIGGSNPAHAPSAQQLVGSSDFDAAILELDTLDIQEAAADAVPLTRLKTNTNSLVTILSWLEYLIRKVGIDETRNTLRYYTEVLRWITPEVFFDLDKYLKGMTDKKSLTPDDRLSVKDHIVSLYFISKLNEKALDDKLTRAVLQIIKQ